MVKVNGAERANVAPGERIEIGRKPMRPLPDDGIPRLEVVDDTRSMSKRHAVFSVESNGAALLRDLDSTNGSYVVSPNGDLMRLPADAEFPLPSTTMRMQFGDVPVDFVRAEHTPEPAEAAPVPDLFGYAAVGSHQEPDAADMSVDDILNLRAGEPTTMFDAAQVQRRAADLNAAESRVYPPADDDAFAGAQVDSMPINVGPIAEPVDEQPRDLFSDALEDADQAESEAMAAAEGWPTAAETAQQPVDEGAHDPETTISVSAIFGAPVAADGPAVVNGDTTDTAGAADANDSDEAAGDTSASEEYQTADEPVEPVESDETAEPVESVEPADSVDPIEPTDNPVASDGQIEGDEAEDYSRYMPTEDQSAGDEQPQEGYSPAFEPGSVFERVSKGEFQQAEPAVEVDGLTSDEAKRTADFSLQFEMARHPQLLPFLAMNPSLYDDLYAWLAAQGDPDIDQALSRNTGYQEYRQAVGK